MALQYGFSNSPPTQFGGDAAHSGGDPGAIEPHDSVSAISGRGGVPGGYASHVNRTVEITLNRRQEVADTRSIVIAAGARLGAAVAGP
jgi:hypothetical protein